jgi:hypothetical protein
MAVTLGGMEGSVAWMLGKLKALEDENRKRR